MPIIGCLHYRASANHAIYIVFHSHNHTMFHSVISLLFLMLFYRAVYAVRCKVIMHILVMHQDDYEYFTKLLFEIDPDSPGAHLLQTPPIFAAANIGDPKLFETLIFHSKIPPSTILKEKHVLEFNSPDGIVISHTDTPLSLILSKPQNYSLIDTLVALDKSDTCKLLTFIDLEHAVYQWNCLNYVIYTV